jgi:NAD(P)-dependent dehydrogenase (short-subunit alcohol dehydrogenase family)
MQKVAMISGASRGIGREIAEELARRGYLLSLGVRSPAGLYGHLGSLVFPYEARDPEAGRRWVDATVERFGQIASLSGKRVKNLNAGYQMSKHAVIALNHAVRRAGWDDGIRATAICPGFVNTDMAASLADLPPEAMTQPEDIALLVANTIEMPNSASVAEILVNCRHEDLF